MSWDESKTEEPQEEPKAEEPKEEEELKEPAKEPEAIDEPQEEPKEEPQEEKMVPQRLIGQVAKSIREKGRSEVAQYQQRVKALEEENRKLRDSSEDQSEEIDQNEEKIRQLIREENLRKQDAYGQEKYGQAYQDAVLLIQSQNDPVLVQKIMGAANPADTLMAEAERLAEEISYGKDPKEREAAKLKAYEAQLRKKWEAEMADKFKARGKQPTDVQNVRTAGGDTKPEYVPDTWATSLRK